MNDLHIAVDTFFALMVMEAIVKPIAIQVGRRAMRRLDKSIDIIPDFLYEKTDD